MNCKRAKLELALLAGRDLDGPSEEQVRRHLAECPCCRDHWQALESALPVLQQVSTQQNVHERQPARGAAEGNRSLWPALSARLAVRPSSIPTPQFPRWVAATAVAAACIALAVYIQQPRSGGWLIPEPSANEARFFPAEDFAELPERDALLDILRQLNREPFPPRHPFDERSLQRSVLNPEF